MSQEGVKSICWQCLLCGLHQLNILGNVALLVFAILMKQDICKMASVDYNYNHSLQLFSSLSLHSLMRTVEQLTLVVLQEKVGKAFWARLFKARLVLIPD